jgi:hypothetical protein
MDELEQLNIILKGFKKIIDGVNNLGVQEKSIQEHLNYIKGFADHMITGGVMFRAVIKKASPEEIKNRFGKDM